MHSNILCAQQKLAAMNQRYQRAVYAVQSNCLHKRTADVQGGRWRMCCGCGMSEAAYAGWLVLKCAPTSPELLWEQWLEQRHGLQIEVEYKGPLLRNETTLAQLLRQYNQPAIKETP
jgi:hypothetical protein